MTIYTPIAMLANIKSSKSDLLELKWVSKALVARFYIPDLKEKVLEVSFMEAEIVRILDEMPLSTEDSTENIGLIPDHLAYTMEGSKFWNDQSDAFKSAYTGCKHYRFITGWNCIDVISTFAPSFAIADSQV